ncbi:MAG: aminoacetone oxidase family FAD-binding enzyme [Oscillospiraceae bacterium]|nr:aminoacetone oxidase family FAD-binding enzyme [Oscillospiraceae bacterium]
MKVLIIGGGASGMMAALTAAKNPENHVTLLERHARVGRKLLATGNGRCNLTNRNLTAKNYHGKDPAFILPALEELSVEQTLAFFRSLGLVTVTEENGKVYPLSDQAGSVVDVLRFALDAAGVQVVCSCDVIDVKKKARGYQAAAATGETYFGDKLIIAAGGCAGKKLGGTHSGYRLLGMLGHSCTELCPSLVQIKTDPTYVRALKGVRADACMTLKQQGHAAAQTVGEVQFTEFGVSGPIAFELSRAASTGGKEQTLLLDLFRGGSHEELLELLKEKTVRFAALETEELLTGILQTRLGKTIIRRAGLDGQKPLGDLTQEDLGKVAALVKCFALDVEGVMGMDHAQVTAGGVPTSEFRADTLESRLALNVYATGEVLDIDGDCGGYNLQWAWSSGYLAGLLK